MDYVTNFIFVYNLLIVSLLTRAEECMKNGPCSCKTSIGEISLSQLSKGQNPRFSAQDDRGYFYQYQPCVDLKGGCGASTTGVAICQVGTGNITYDAGDQVSVQFSGDPNEETLSLSYHSAGGGTSRKSVIALKCAENVEGNFKFLNESPSSTYNFDLQTKYACLHAIPAPQPKPSGLSTGSVLLIVLFVLLAVYFIAGILFLKFARGAQGKEIIPNYDFWTALPGLVKDGVLFTSRGCKKDTSYSQI